MRKTKAGKNSTKYKGNQTRNYKCKKPKKLLTRKTRGAQLTGTQRRTTETGNNNRTTDDLTKTKGKHRDLDNEP